MTTVITSPYRRSEFFIECGLIAIGLILSVLMFKTLMIHTDNTQLMDKAVKVWAQNEWTHYGNAATKMGSLPGSFLTVVTAVPMLLYFSPYSAMAIILLFHFFSYLLLRKMGQQSIQNFSPLWLAIVYWLNPWRVEQAELYNPGYLFLFAALHLYFIKHLFLDHSSVALNSKFSDYFKLDFSLNSSESKQSFWMTLGLALTVGVCLQVHFSVLILAVSFLFLFLSRKIRLHFFGGLFGVMLISLSLLPWYLQKSQIGGTEIHPASDTFIGKNFLLVYPVLKAIIYFFRMGSMYFGRHIFSEVQFLWISSENWRQVISVVFHVLKYPLAIVSLLYSARYFVSFFKNIKNQAWSKVSFLPAYVVSMVIGILLASGLSPVEFNHWHFILVFPVIALVLSQSFHNFSKYRQKQIQIVLVIIFIFWNIFAALGSRSHSYLNDYERDFFKHYEQQINEKIKSIK